MLQGNAIIAHSTVKLLSILSTRVALGLLYVVMSGEIFMLCIQARSLVISSTWRMKVPNIISNHSRSSCFTMQGHIQKIWKGREGPGKIFANLPNESANVTAFLSTISQIFQQLVAKRGVVLNKWPPQINSASVIMYSSEVTFDFSSTMTVKNEGPTNY